MYSYDGEYDGVSYLGDGLYDGDLSVFIARLLDFFQHFVGDMAIFLH